MKIKNSLKRAQKNRSDEFYTLLVDIENELNHYVKHFKNKVIYCNCDDPRASNFFRHFHHNFERYGLKKLIASCYKPTTYNIFTQKCSEKAVYLEYEGGKSDIKEFIGDGDFRGQESIKLLEQADIVATNPPFSLFREYIAQLEKYDKKFVIIGNVNGISYKGIFKLLKANKIWFGHSIRSGNREFRVPDDYPLYGSSNRVDEDGNKYIRVKGVQWFTNLDYKKENCKDIVLTKSYKNNENDYPKYYNYDAIEVSKVKDIPMDYTGEMGVPITFMNKYNPEQFEIVGLANDKREIHNAFVQGNEVYLDEQHKKFVGMILKEGNTLRATYARIIIKHKAKQ